MKFTRIKIFLRIIKRFYNLLTGKDRLFRRQLLLKTEKHGDIEAAWHIYPASLKRDSVIYSFGIGENISCELSIIQKFGVNIFIFDPTPRSIHWIKTQELPENIVVHEIGLADYDGIGQFFPPDNPNFISYTMLPGIYESRTSQTLNVNRLQTIMKKLNHSKLDILKMDIEGFEYAAIDDILNSGLDIEQILIEFHHRFPNLTLQKTKETIEKLNQHGYKIFYSSILGEEYGFIRNFV